MIIKKLYIGRLLTCREKTMEHLIKYIKNLINNDKGVITYEGKFDFMERTQLWFQYTDKTHIIKKGTYADDIRWVLPYEIINLRKMLTFSIDKRVTNLFLFTPKFYLFKK